MNERIVQFRVGVLMLASMVITFILVMLFADLPTIAQRTYTLQVRFAEVPGVESGTPVRMYGILIGRVTDVGFAEDGSGAVVTVAIHSDVKLRRDVRCRISRNGLLGDTVLEFIPAPRVKTGASRGSSAKSAPVRSPSAQNSAASHRPAPPGQRRLHLIAGDGKHAGAQLAQRAGDEDEEPDEVELLEEGDVVIGIVTKDPLQVAANLEENLTEAISSISRTSDEIGLLARRVSDILADNDEQVARIVDNAEQTLDRFRSAAENIDELLGDPVLRQDLKESIAALPETLERVRSAATGFEGTLAGIDRNLENLEGLTGPLGERGQQLIANIESATMNLDRLLTQLVTFGDALTDPRGSLGQFLSNPDVYEQIHEAATNINELTAQLKPIVRDARTFADKIARHPEQLGVRGALRPGSGIKRSPSELMGRGDATERTRLHWGLPGH